MEAVKDAHAPYPLIAFNTPESLSEFRAMSDADIGGFSKSELTFYPPSSATTPPLSTNSTSSSHAVPSTSKSPLYSTNSNYNYPCARWHGSISTELPRNNPEVIRTGYAGVRSLDRRRTLFGKSLWDIDPYAYLALRIKSDGRKYFINLQSESIVASDIHQHRLYAKTPGQWETVFINWNDFVRTNHGQVVEPQGELLRQSIRTLGVSLTDRVPGPFELWIERMWATNRTDQERPNEKENPESES
jgi:NADH dehydrogenase [ubiquinone] 1 alpha subcomplex assembly factor 1